MVQLFQNWKGVIWILTKMCFHQLLFCTGTSAHTKASKLYSGSQTGPQVLQFWESTKARYYSLLQSHNPVDLYSNKKCYQLDAACILYNLLPCNTCQWLSIALMTKSNLILFSPNFPTVVIINCSHFICIFSSFKILLLCYENFLMFFYLFT